MKGPDMTLAVCNGNFSTLRAKRLADMLKVPLLDVEWHRYPDGESGVRVPGTVPETVVVLADLDHPDPQLLPLLFLLDTLRELGARRLVLVLPYLPYLRQDARFRSGEAITSRTFAQLLSPFCDHLVTLDPHLHRYHALSEIYTVTDTVLTTADAIGVWIAANVEHALLVGPDSESRQWVSRAAEAAHAPFVVLEKTRHGDRDVDIALPDDIRLDERTPVLVDDIISSGHTMAQTVRALRKNGARAPLCIGVHGLFAGDALALLENSGAASIVTSNTIEHASNAIDVFPLLASALAEILPTS